MWLQWSGGGWQRGSGPDTSPASCGTTQQHTCNELQHQILKLLTRENFGTANGYSFLCRLAVAGLVITEHYISPTRDYIRHSENSSSILTLIPWWTNNIRRGRPLVSSPWKLALTGDMRQVAINLTHLFVKVLPMSVSVETTYLNTCFVQSFSQCYVFITVSMSKWRNPNSKAPARCWSWQAGAGLFHVWISLSYGRTPVPSHHHNQHTFTLHWTSGTCLVASKHEGIKVYVWGCHVVILMPCYSCWQCQHRDG